MWLVPCSLHHPDDGENGLHMGAKYGSTEVTTLCLDVCFTVFHNNNLESFFDIILMKGDVKCASTVIRHNRYQEALDLVYPFHGHPMLSLIAYFKHAPRIGVKPLWHLWMTAP